MEMRYNLFLVLLFINCQVAIAQNNRLETFNKIGWYSYTGTFKVSEKVGIHTEYQWRRNNLITSWQQSLLRTGLNYTLSYFIPIYKKNKSHSKSEKL
jgi:hypothetical protein